MMNSNTKSVDTLTEKLKALPQKLQTKITRTILRDALKQSQAREELISYIKTHFNKRTGIYQSSVSTIKTSRVKSDHNKIISYIYFLPLSKVGNKKRNHIPPRILTHWLNAGTRDHAVGKGSRLKANDTVQKISENKYQIIINNARINLAKAKTEKQKNKYSGIIERNTKRLANIKDRAIRKNKQFGTKVKGITAHHFMESIQNQVASNAVTIVFESVQEAMTDLLK